MESENNIDSESESDLQIEITYEINNETNSESGNSLDSYLNSYNQIEQPDNYFRNYLSERTRFENEMYDHLISSTTFNGIFFVYTNVIETEIENGTYPDDTFWDPVVVSYDKVELLENVDESSNCSVCTEDQESFKRLKCCSQKLCIGCCEEWFGRSVKCPYCYQDLRDFDE